MEYRFSTGTVAPPAAGNVQLNSSTASAATLVWASNTTALNNDATVALGAITVGSTVTIQVQTDSTSLYQYQSTATPMNKGTYTEIPVSWVKSGTGPAVANNASIFLAVSVAGQPGPQGPAGPGVPAGGTSGQVLQKTAAGDYATGWVTPPTIPTTLPPSGPAGGSLAGTYPNPALAAAAVKGSATGNNIATKSIWADSDIADNSVTDRLMVSLAYAKLTGAPTALPPSGTAAGDLSGSYPAPTVAKLNGQALTAGDTYYVSATPAIARLAANATATKKYLQSVSSGVPSWQQLAYTDVSGTPTSLPPSGAASGDLAGTYPGPTVAKLNGAALGTTTPLARGDLLVADGTPALKRLPLGTASQVLQSNGTDVVWGASLGGPPSGAAGGSLAGTYPNPTLAASGVTAGSYGTARTIPTFTVTAEGRVTAVTVVTLIAQWK